MANVRITNLTRGTDLAQEARLAQDPVTRLLGLLGRRSLPAGGGLVLRPCSSIHMLGMRFAVDALFLDSRYRVVRAVSRLRPWRIGPIEPRADSIIALPAGAIDATGTAVGDQLALTPSTGIGWKEIGRA